VSPWFVSDYFPTIKIVNVPAIAAARPARPPGGAGGAGPRSSAIVKICPVWLSNAIVRDLPVGRAQDHHLRLRVRRMA
jgi:hypothetical protein